ncbi:hypothetical protein Agabi119p4_5629 [Agaricus bisporus var. burnettii]|uniref:NACHT domain-containing protein n=1 Tax=Agaricus bisporus var. burnettii TaxID=192524 RepID=A0A8H7F218_AGABI|nr:hypothetical protein Agabi119p4_5629 [Agaricus bisporus var. burnettii]
MSHDSSAARPSSPRYIPSSSSSSLTPTPSRHLPLPPAPLSGHGPERSSSDNYLSPAHAYYPYAMNSVTDSKSKPIYAMPSTSTHQLDHSTHQVYSFPHPPTPLAQVPFFQRPYHPTSATNTQDPALIHPPNIAQHSVTIHRPDSTYQNYAIHQRQHQFHTTQSGQVVPRQGQTYYGNGMFKNPRDFCVMNSTFIDNSNTLDNFMNEFLQHTIIGAEFDSSDRHPPPRCHPGTRRAIIERYKNFIVQCEGKGKMRWVVGGAGVGKSAIMQIVAEEIPADASVFFSVNGRNNGTKLFITIAYQLAVKYDPYRRFIQSEINRDPSLLRKSLPTQFQKFIIDPFIHYHRFSDSQRFLIIIDGLDECDNPTTQRDILGLISYFCIKYPTSSIVWIVASRPEPHITSFFDDASVTPAYTKEEIEIDSDEAYEEVQQYLRDELNKIKLASPTLKHKREWPPELEFTKIATASGGLFAYASTIVRYIGDPHYRDPVAQLGRVLEDINDDPKDGVPRSDHPLARLDALYQRILSNIPADAMINTRKLLLVYLVDWWNNEDFHQACNRVGLSETAAYGAVSHLHAIVKVPTRDKADEEDLEFLHKSFPDFLFDFKRSRFSHNLRDEAEQFLAQTSIRIVEQVEVPDDLDSMDGGEGAKCNSYGCLKDGPGFCDNIALSWPGDGRYEMSDDWLKLKMYRDSMEVLGRFFPTYRLYSAFDEFRPGLEELGKLNQVPLRALNYATIRGWIDIRFISPAGIGKDAKHSDPWNASCTHEKENVDGLHGWKTFFFWCLDTPGDEVPYTDIPRFNTKAGEDFDWEATYPIDTEMFKCLYCSRRLARQFSNNADQLVTIFVDSTEMCYVEFELVDPDDD